MSVTYTEAARQAGEPTPPLQQATEQLKEVLGESFGRVKAEWERAEDERGRTTYALRLADLGDEATGRFAPDELRSSERMRIRLYRLWDEVLKARNERQLRELTTLLSQ